MTAAITPVETRYKGYRFRSRLEARWAVAFDHLDISWKYEPEGYELPSGEWYLPDFEIKVDRSTTQGVLAEGPYKIAVEVKGDWASFTSWAKLWEFVDNKPLLILGDIPEPQAGWPSALFPLLVGDASFHTQWLIYFCGKGTTVWLTYAERMTPGERIWTEPREVSEAWEAARSARFEHGESRTMSAYQWSAS